MSIRAWREEPIGKGHGRDTFDCVAAWYQSYGAVPVLDAPLSLLLPLKTVEAALKVAKR